jgi:energy-coupling factor transporter ATP-binding protein EcfA2
MNFEEKKTFIYNAFKPNDSAKTQYYEDCHKARGGKAFVKKIKDRLLAEQDNLRFLFTGHVGCGKSSELKRLARIIESETTVFPVYIDFDDYLNQQDVDLEDVFLGVIWGISLSLPEMTKQCLDKSEEIKPKIVSYSVLKKIGDVISKIKLKTSISTPFELGKVDVEISKGDANVRQEIRSIIKGSEKKTLLSELKDLILDIELQLKQKTSYTKLLIIADSLEHVRKFEEAKDNLDSLRAFFIGKEQELNLNTHVIYTVPLELCYSEHGTTLADVYGLEPFSLPMVKTHIKNDFDTNYQIGWDILKELVETRLRTKGLSLDEIFEEDALNHLIKFSGGHIRSLIRFIQSACLEAEEYPINFSIARQSVKETVNVFARTVREPHWAILAKLEDSDSKQIENGNNDYAELIKNLSIFEYRNGNGNDDENDVWFAVNPSIRRTIKFQEALEKLKSQQ